MHSRRRHTEDDKAYVTSAPKSGNKESKNSGYETQLSLFAWKGSGPSRFHTDFPFAVKNEVCRLQLGNLLAPNTKTNAFFDHARGVYL